MVAPIYLNPVEICSLLLCSTPKSDLCPQKYFSFQDITIIKCHESVLAVVTADKEFAETLRHIKIGTCKVNTVFTPVTRCNIINYEDYCDKISIAELICRYGEQV